MGTFQKEDCDKQKIISMMAGQVPRWSKEPPEEGNKKLGEELLRLSHVTDGNLVKDISFTLRRGEVLGIAGVVGSGRTSLLKVLFGLRPKKGGEILIRGKETAIRNPQSAIRKGIGLMPEERVRQGLFMNLTLEENMMISSIRRFTRWGGCCSPAPVYDGLLY